MPRRGRKKSEGRCDATTANGQTKAVGRRGKEKSSWLPLRAARGCQQQARGARSGSRGVGRARRACGDEPRLGGRASLNPCTSVRRRVTPSARSVPHPSSSDSGKMFDGSFRTAKRVALGGASKDKGDRASLLEQARKDREERSRRRAETRSVSLIQVRPTSDLIRSRKTRHLLPVLAYAYFEYENFARVFRATDRDARADCLPRYGRRDRSSSLRRPLGARAAR